MKIANHRMQNDDGTPVAFVRSPNGRGDLTPLFLVMHYTAGRNAASSIDWLTNQAAGASAHLVIAQDGTITQLMPFNKVAWHAGKSEWEGLKQLNRHSIGIELDNAGPLTRQGSTWRTWFGAEIPAESVIEARHKHGGEIQGWHAYTELQLAAAIDASVALVKKYKLQDVIGHDDIAPGRKQDPGPAFPMASFHARVMGRRADADETYQPIAALNIRSGPGVNFEKLPQSPLPTGSRLVLRQREDKWCFVDVLDTNLAPDFSGWVHGGYIRRVD